MRRVSCLLTLAATMIGGVPAAADTPEPTPSGRPSAVLVIHVDDPSILRSASLAQAIGNADGTVRHAFPGQSAVSIAVPAAGLSATSARLANLPGVAQVEKPVVRTFAGTPTPVPNDPRFTSQRRYLDAVHAPQAWQRQRGSPGVTIAIIDSGIDVGHPDLAGKVVATYNAHTPGSSSIVDTVGHGTFVAGVAAADTDNGIGVAGAGYDTSLMGVKIADPDGDISIDDEVAGIRWAVTHGATIINLSISGPDPSTAEKNAISYAQSKGVLVVAAAGNGGDTTKQYPAAYPGVVSVGETDPGTRRRAAFTTRGSWVTLAAPGVGIYSTTPRAGSDYFGGRPGYASGDGTSFATPLVAGEAALLKAQNPTMSASRLRAALIASAHGYGASGLGAGQVDFALALRHVTPTTRTTATTVVGNHDTVQFDALSTTPRVAYRVDDDAVSAPVPVVDGLASRRWGSYGFADGAHVLTAVDCSEFGECARRGATSRFTLTSTAPTVISPMGERRVTGLFTVTATSSGGALRLLLDGHEVGFDTHAPYAFAVNASRLSDARHRLQVQVCSTDHRHCGGKRSAAIPFESASLHPTITALHRARTSPNGDGAGDTGQLVFRLASPQSVTIETRDATGSVRRHESLGTVSAGTHTWTWRGRDAHNHRLTDGRYTLALVTSSTSDGLTRRGFTSHTAAVDTVAPHFTHTTGNKGRVYPAKDGYRDSFAPSTILRDDAKVVLRISTTGGRAVRTLSASGSRDHRVTIRWSGRRAGGTVVAAGAYRWTLTAADAAGNARRSRTYTVSVSAKRLQEKVVALTVPAGDGGQPGHTARCASTSRNLSRFRGGVLMRNHCTAASGELAYVRYAFRVPAAHSYRSLAVSIYGGSRRASGLSAAFQRNDGGLELPDHVRVGRATDAWHRVAAVPADSHVDRSRLVHVTVLLSGQYTGANDFDAGWTRLRVRYLVLR